MTPVQPSSENPSERVITQDPPCVPTYLGGQETLEGAQSVKVRGLVDVLAVGVGGDGVELRVVHAGSHTDGQDGDTGGLGLGGLGQGLGGGVT